MPTIKSHDLPADTLRQQRFRCQFTPLLFSLAVASALALSLAPSTALAASGRIAAVTVSPSPAVAGQPVQVTVTAEGEAPNRCGLRVEFGDGNKQHIKINDTHDHFPVTVTNTFANPGTYTIKAEGKKVTTHFGCMGEATVNLVVEAAVKKEVTALCPAGYTLTSKPDRLGAYRCKAGKGAKAPDTPINCPSPLVAYQSKTTVGCQAAKITK